MKVNYHTHTQRCRHAQGSEEDYVQSAIHSGVSILGFSDHAPFPDRDFGLRMSYDELRPHVDCLDELTKKYQDSIILWKGLEIEYLPEYLFYYEDLLTKEGFEYLILGEHFYRNQEKALHNIAMANSTSDYLEYAEAVSQAIKTGYFKIVAHPDIYGMNLFAWDTNCDRATDLIIDTAIKYKVILEYNANGLRREEKDYPDGFRYQYPHQIFWQNLSQTEAVVIVGSDCHNPSQVWDEAVERAYDNLSELRITPVLRF